MIGVMPIGVFSANDHFLRGVKFSSASKHRAERSFCCARGRPREIKNLIRFGDVLMVVIHALRLSSCSSNMACVGWLQ